MPQQVTFWRRVGRLLRGNLSGNGETGPSLGTGVLEPADPRPVAGGRTADPDGALARSSSGEALQRLAAVPAPWWKPAARRAQAQAAALRAAELANALQEHFRRQDERSAALATALDRLGGVLEQIADNQRAQSESLRTITEHTDSAARHAASVVSTLARVPESLHAQAEALRGVARQLELGQTSDTQLLQSMQQFGRVVDTLGASGTAQVEALRSLAAAQQRQQEALSTAVQEQSRRYQVVVIITSVVAIAAIAVAVVSVVQGR